jgi:hypothetical protein
VLKEQRMFEIAGKNEKRNPSFPAETAESVGEQRKTRLIQK